MRPEDIIDLGAYPITDPDAPARAELIARLSRELSQNQYCTLPGFINPAALERVVKDVTEIRPRAFDNNLPRNCYLHQQGDPALPPDHPRNIIQQSSTRMIADDLLAEDSPLKILYHWQPMRQMVTDIVGAERLYDSADRFQPVNVLCAEVGDQAPWHYDTTNAFTMTLMLQAPAKGGDFELVPNSRSDTDQNYDFVGEVLTGKRPDDVVRIPRALGSLCIFRGCNSLHRVTAVEAGPMRMMAVFVYEAQPGVIGDPTANATTYGPRAVAP
ncbi:MAG: hypothetical protein HQ501_00680 [Rhodospirillales bacterium]|nr:hypothetical protein [Rhodospirillales bacterium]